MNIYAAQLNQMNLIHQQIIQFLLGMKCNRPHSLKETAEKFGLSKNKVRYIKSLFVRNILL